MGRTLLGAVVGLVFAVATVMFIEFAGRQVQGLGEPLQVVVGHGQPHGHGVAAELLHVGGAALQHLEQVDARHGPPGAFQPHNPLFLFLDGEQDGRPAEAVHHP